MTGNDDHRTYTDDEIADIVRKGIYSWSGPSYNPLREDRPELTALPLFVRVTDNNRVRAVFRLVPVFGDTEGYLVDEKASTRVRLDQIEPGDDAGAGDRAARYLSMLQVTLDDRGTYQVDLANLDENELGIDLEFKDREARRDRPTVVTYDAEERAARHLPMLWVVYDEVRDIYRFDMRPLNERGSRTCAGHLFDARADRLARVLLRVGLFNEGDATVDLVRAGLDRPPD